MHQDEGHYSAKHAAGTALNEAAAEVLKKFEKDERISCRDAHNAAGEAGISPAEAGTTIDLLEIRINSCQLGLFGYKNGKPAGFQPPGEESSLAAAIEKYTAVGSIDCLGLWKAADETGCSRMQAAAFCENKGIKISNCQLGAF